MQSNSFATGQGTTENMDQVRSNNRLLLLQEEQSFALYRSRPDESRTQASDALRGHDAPVQSSSSSSTAFNTPESESETSPRYRPESPSLRYQAPPALDHDPDCAECQWIHAQQQPQQRQQRQMQRQRQRQQQHGYTLLSPVHEEGVLHGSFSQPLTDHQRVRSQGALPAERINLFHPRPTRVITAASWVAIDTPPTPSRDEGPSLDQLHENFTSLAQEAQQFLRDRELYWTQTLARAGYFG